MSGHIEVLTDSIVLIYRMYSKSHDGGHAYQEKEDFDASCVVLWHPITNCATIKGLKNFDLSRREMLEEIITMFENLYEAYDIDVVEWDRASGKLLKKCRVGKRRWINF